MKILESLLIAAVVTLFLAILIKVANPTLFQPPHTTTYECPCEVDQLVTDVVRHTNKDGMTTVTTYIEIKDCIQSNNN